MMTLPCAYPFAAWLVKRSASILIASSRETPTPRRPKSWALARFLIHKVIALRWQDIDLEAGIAKVMRTLKITLEGRQFGRVKTKHSNRTIALPEVAMSALRDHLARQRDERTLLGDTWNDNDLVFCNEIGKRLPTSRLDGCCWFGRLLKRAGVPLIHFHGLRHTAATLLLARGVSVKVVSEMLGHSSVVVTLTLYGHVLPHMQRDAAITMDQVLKGITLP
jgi:integrase